MCNVRETRGAVAALVTARDELRDTLWLTNTFIGEGSDIIIPQLAPALWNEVRRVMENLLVTIGERMDSYHRGVANEMVNVAELRVRTPARLVQCPVCEDQLPTVCLNSCGHVLCPECAARLYRCPVCRRTIVGRMNIYM